LLGSAGKA